MRRKIMEIAAKDFEPNRILPASYIYIYRCQLGNNVVSLSHCQINYHEFLKICKIIIPPRIEKDRVIFLCISPQIRVDYTYFWISCMLFYRNNLLSSNYVEHLHTLPFKPSPISMIFSSWENLGEKREEETFFPWNHLMQSEQFEALIFLFVPLLPWWDNKRDNRQ